MAAPVRLQLRRAAGFRLQEASREVNGLPARVVTRPGLFGNIFRVSDAVPAEDAVRSFRRFMKTWSDAQLTRSTTDQDGAPNPIAGIGLIVLRNSIRARVWTLRGHNLACFCGLDRPCHADVYLGILATDLPERWKAKYPALCEGVKP